MRFWKKKPEIEAVDTNGDVVKVELKGNNNFEEKKEKNTINYINNSSPVGGIKKFDIKKDEIKE